MSPSVAAADIQFDAIEDTISSFSRAHFPKRYTFLTQDLESGQFVIILDSATRENEGDLIISASSITTAQMAFMIRHTSGLICTPLSAQLATALDLPQMVTHNTESHQTAYTVSVDASHEDVTTGISAHDRALTCRSLASADAVAADFRRPGHIFPLKANVGGLVARQGHTEAAVALCRLAGLREVAVISELVSEDAEVVGKAERDQSGMMRRDECLAFARKWGLKIATIEQLVEFVERNGSTQGANGKAI